MQQVPGVKFLPNGQAQIVLWAPYAKKVMLSLPGKQLTLGLEQKDRGYWELTTDQLKPFDHYQFIVNDKKNLPDPASKSQPGGVHGPSEAIDVRDFAWTDVQWKNIPLAEYLIYELHTGTFTTEGTFEGVQSKLSYLKNLGVTAIELMPVAQFPGERNWGYDGVFLYAVQNSYGGAKGLMALIDACHQNGLAVILDAVYNHVGPEGNYFSEFGPYFTDKYHTPWGNALNFDDAWCDEVRNYFIQNALMWFRDFHVDALRLDAVHAIKDFSPVHILRELKQEVDKLATESGRSYYLIIENDLNDTRFIEPLEQKGYGMDTQWVDEFHHALRVTAGGERTGYYADFNGILQLAKSYGDAYVYDGIYSPQRLKTFGTKTTERNRQQFVVFSQNHDHIGNRMLGERSSMLFSFEMQKLMAAAVLVSTFLPLLFMGEEWSDPNPFLYFVSHTDKKLIEAVRKGRKAEFAAFHTKGEAPDPQAEGTFERSKLNWDLLAKGKHQTMLAYYKALIALRKQLPALYHLDRENLKVTCNTGQQTLQLYRWHHNQHVFCLMNFSKQVVQLPVTDLMIKQVLNSAVAAWGGPVSSTENTHAASVTIQPESIIIYTN